MKRSVVCDEIPYATKDEMLSRRKLKETLCFLFVLFVISVNIRLILCSRFIAKNVLQVTSELYTEIHFQGLALRDQAEDWSTLRIGVSHGTISTLSSVAPEDRREREREWKERKTIELSTQKNL